MAWTQDNTRELREFLAKDTGLKLIADATSFSDETLGKGNGFEEVSLSSKNAEGRKDMLNFIKGRGAVDEKSTTTSDFVDVSDL